MTNNKSIPSGILSIILLCGALVFIACPTDSSTEEPAAGTPVAQLSELAGTWVGGSGGGGSGGGGSTDGKLVIKITNSSTGAGTIQKNGGTEVNCTYAVPSSGKLTVTYTEATSAEDFDASINDVGALILKQGETTWTLTSRGTGSGGGGRPETT
jgi:hypothetical protein